MEGEERRREKRREDAHLLACESITQVAQDLAEFSLLDHAIVLLIQSLECITHGLILLKRGSKLLCAVNRLHTVEINLVITLEPTISARNRLSLDLQHHNEQHNQDHLLTNCIVSRKETATHKQTWLTSCVGLHMNACLPISSKISFNSFSVGFLPEGRISHCNCNCVRHVFLMESGDCRQRKHTQSSQHSAQLILFQVALLLGIKNLEAFFNLFRSSSLHGSRISTRSNNLATYHSDVY